ncbi:predicted protein [Histoplasma capsulatum G186AR]|uniref:Uncharacterized protein n=1 Tax=Ajellomyces capsulatus (strain G186AR / H82 / ATCC MYA-2454 / RMSCC 2432) TaxID=447093 RepID=C0NM97_AJECG|nr:uncharacterized protein HCBG_04627 [Histoplasma capsulatum G186AR]EEH07748.1 predicted protein [Histoplasma capsulatum G186AR]
MQAANASWFAREALVIASARAEPTVGYSRLSFIWEEGIVSDVYMTLRCLVPSLFFGRGESHKNAPEIQGYGYRYECLKRVKPRKATMALGTIIGVATKRNTHIRSTDARSQTYWTPSITVHAIPEAGFSYFQNMTWFSSSFLYFAYLVAEEAEDA